MNFINRLAIALAVLILVLSGGLYMLISVDWIPIERVEEILGNFNNKLILALSGCFLWLISLTIAYTDHRLVEQEKAVILSGALGEVKILKSAIEDFITKVVTEEYSVREAKPKLILKKRGSLVHLNVGVDSSIPIPEIVSKLQNRVKDSLENVIGIQNLRDIRVKVKRIVHSRGREIITLRRKR
jgi:uncharacterized alkaline shock family protein YloU